MGNKNSCLVIKNDGIGDLILTSGIISELSKHFNGQLDLVTFEQNREVVDLMDGIRETYFVSRGGFNFLPYTSRLGIYIPYLQGGNRGVIKKIRQKEYEYAIVLRRFIRQSTLIIMSKIRAKQKYCAWQFPTNTSKDIANRFSDSFEHVTGDLRVLSEQTYYKQFIAKIFNISINPEPRMNIPNSDQNLNSKKNVGICIAGRSGTWPLRYWLDFIKEVQMRGYHVSLFGGEREKKMGEILQDNLIGVTNHIGKLSLKESIQYLQNLDVLIGNDTGFTHFASLIVKKIIVVLGGGTFRRFFPWPQNKNQFVIYYGLSCFDCDWKCPYSQPLCLNMIGSNDLIEYFEEVVSANKIARQKNMNPSSCRYKIAWQRSPRTEFVRIDGQAKRIKSNLIFQTK
jgi:ADP-heptose:LPS heptosyltransferase